jgi:hypothetical protein
MRYYLVNKDGVTVERNITKEQLKTALAIKRYRMATLDERRAYLRKQREKKPIYLTPIL